MEKLYTSEELDLIRSNIHLSFKDIAEKVGRTEQAIRQKTHRENIKKLKSYNGHDYITQSEFIKEITQIEWITFGIYLGIKNLIKFKGKGMLSTNEYYKWLFFFKEHYPSRYLKSLLPEKYQNRFSHWIHEPFLKVVSKGEKRQNKYWIPKQQGDQLIELVENYIQTSEFAEAVNYERSYIIKLINSGVLKDFKIFASQYWINKKEILNLKQRYKNL